MNNRKQKRKGNVLLLLILLVSISIGYALLSQELAINGTSKIKNNTWDIHFANLEPNQNNVTLSTGDVAATINPTTQTSIDYTVTLQKPGDFYEFTVDVVNGGTIDGMVGSVSSKLDDVEIDSEHPLPSYLNYSVTYSDGVAIAPNHLLAVGARETYKVRIEFKKDITKGDLISEARTLELNFTVNYVQADENAITKPLPPAEWTLPTGKTVNNLESGDELCIVGTTTECFNFVKYDGNDVVLLTKYNLNVGNHAKDSETFLQDSNVRGYTGSSNYGMVAFSANTYWYDNGIIAKYGSGSGQNNIYDSAYVTAPDFSNNGLTLSKMGE